MFKYLRNYTMFLVLMAVSGSALSVVEIRAFSSDQQRDRYQVLVNELRCPKCQNQNLADSNSPIAADLRKEIFRMLEEGKSDQEIVDFLVARYGEFVMYRPPVKKTTLMLWLAPGLLLVGGVIIMLTVRRRQSPERKAKPILKAEELDRLDELLGESSLGETGDSPSISEKGSKDK